MIASRADTRLIGLNAVSIIFKSERITSNESWVNYMSYSCHLHLIDALSLFVFSLVCMLVFCIVLCL
jgi:hypothetical protein